MQQPTSLSAYWNEIQPRLGERQREVFRIITAYGGDWTNSEIAAHSKKPINTITPRIFELRKLGLVEESQKRICKVTGRRVIAWKRVQKAPVVAQEPRVAVPLFNR